MDIDELPLRATLSEDLDDDDASGLSIVLEEEDGPVIRVTNPEGATALGFANRLKDAVLGANINLDIQYDADDEELTIQHREIWGHQRILDHKFQRWNTNRRRIRTRTISWARHKGDNRR